MADEDTEISRSQQQNQDFVVVPKATLTQKSIGLVVDHCHNCDAPSSSLEQQNGKVICTACGSFAGPGAIISDVQFSENAAGAATLQGARVGQDQSRAKTFSGSRNRAIDGLSSKEQSQERGKREIGKLRAVLRISQAAADQAYQHYKLAHIHGFTRGRRLDLVAAACLAAAVRRQKSSFMLIDFSEVLAVNVFKLGQVFKELLEEVDVGDDKIYMLQVPPENLVYRFAQRLDFGDLTEKVANDTVRLIKRMNYDWITEGRRPSGVCGACIILAARMNNFRRTTREVMFVAKISDSTIQERLNEFKRTKTSQMTVDELRAAPNTQDVGQYPPSFYKPFVKQRAKHEKLKKSRKGKHQSEFTAEELQDLIDNGEDEAEDAEPVARRSKRRRTNTKNVSNPQTSDSSPRTPVDPSILSEENLRPPSHTAATDRSDAEVAQRLLQLSGLAHSESRTNVIVPVQGHALDDDHQALPANTSPASGSAVPQTPLSPQDSGYVTQLTQRGVDRQLQQDVEAELAVIKGRKRDRRLKEQPAIPTTEEILLEREVESMIEQHLQDPRLQSAFTDIQSNADIVKNQLRGDKGKEAFSDYHDQAALLAQQISESHRSAISNPSVGTEDPLQDDEFDDDPEVANVLLNPEEQRLKETIWTHANRDHLRREIERKHRADMKAAQPARRQSGKGGPGSRKRAPPIGMGQTKEFATAEEAAADMMERRGGRELSRKLNYKSLGDMQKGLAGVFTIDESKVAAAIKRNKVNWDDYAGSAGEDGDGAETATNNGRLVDLQNVREADDEDAGFDNGVVEELSNEVDERARQQAEEEHEFADDDDEY